MGISAGTIRRIAALQLSAEAMAEVLSIIAEVHELSSRPDQRSVAAIRQARYRERKASQSVTDNVTDNVTDYNGSVTNRNKEAQNALRAPAFFIGKEFKNITPSDTTYPQTLFDFGYQFDAHVIAWQANCQKSKQRRGGTSLPADWRPNEELVNYGTKLGLTDGQTREILENMRLWAIANKNRPIARKADWTSTMQGALRRDASKFIRQNNNPRAPPRDRNGLSLSDVCSQVAEKLRNARSNIHQNVHTDRNTNVQGNQENIFEFTLDSDAYVETIVH